jgi:hypothetical protein
MTTLVGIQGKDFIIFAADSQITDGDQRIISVETPKIISVGKYLLGLTGDSRPGDILAYAWKPPLYRGEDPTTFMGSKVIPSISESFKDGNYEIDNKDMNFSFLISLDPLPVAFACLTRALKKSYSLCALESLIYLVCLINQFLLNFFRPLLFE